MFDSIEARCPYEIVLTKKSVQHRGGIVVIEEPGNVWGISYNRAFHSLVGMTLFIVGTKICQIRGSFPFMSTRTISEDVINYDVSVPRRLMILF